MSEAAKGMIRGLLTVDPARRLTATQALGHPWVLTDCAPTNPLPASSRLRQYAERMRLPVRIVRHGELLIKQGDVGTEAFLIRKGECEIFIEEHLEGPEGPVTEIRIATRKEDEVVGEIAVMEKEGAEPQGGGAGGILALAAGDEAQQSSPKQASPNASHPATGTAAAGSRPPLPPPQGAAGSPNASPAPTGRRAVVPPHKGPSMRVASTDGTGHRRTASVRALSDMVVLVLRREALAKIFDEDEGVASSVISEAELRLAKIAEMRHNIELSSSARALRHSMSSPGGLVAVLSKLRPGGGNGGNGGGAAGCRVLGQGATPLATPRASGVQLLGLASAANSGRVTSTAGTSSDGAPPPPLPPPHSQFPPPLPPLPSSSLRGAAAAAEADGGAAGPSAAGPLWPKDPSRVLRISLSDPGKHRYSGGPADGAASGGSTGAAAAAAGGSGGGPQSQSQAAATAPPQLPPVAREPTLPGAIRDEQQRI